MGIGLKQQQKQTANPAPIQVRRIEAWALRAPIRTPVETSFGIMRDRPAVFLRVEDEAGACGLGEIWCNFPGCGAEHRVAMATQEIGPLVAGREFASPADAFGTLSDRVRVRVLQTGEAGPYRQVIAGLDIALWDLQARKTGMPLRRCLNEAAADAVPAYASGIHIAAAADMIPAARRQGYRAFKVKVGFDAERDLAMLKEVAAGLQDGERLFMDANQAWDTDAALAFSRACEGLGIGWFEEPVPADTPLDDWARLAKEGAVPLAAGENHAGDAFDAVLAQGSLSYVQPDVAKWGGVSRCYPLAQAILDAGKCYCPHFLGGGIGLAASAHLLAAAGGPGLLEVDANPNPLREGFGFGEMSEGMMRLPDGAGLGIPELPSGMMEYVTLHREWSV